MKRVIICGAGGQMGKYIAEKIKGDPDFEIAFGVDPNETASDFTVFKSFDRISDSADVIIDFSHHTAVKSILNFAEKHSIPVVIATTGHTEEEKEMIRRSSERIPIFFASNMSLGIAVLGDLVKKAVDAFPDSDIELVEMHHNRKIDAPSGTLKTIMEIIKESRPEAKFIFGRCGMEKRTKNEIGVHVLRLGGEIGVHKIIISSNDEEITLEHRAYSRTAFAQGAVNAAKFICVKNAGLYSMKDYLLK